MKPSEPTNAEPSREALGLQPAPKPEADQMVDFLAAFIPGMLELHPEEARADILNRVLARIGHSRRGKLHPPRTAFLHMHVGTAALEDRKYRMSTGATNGAPIITSEQTGKHYTLSWQDILDLASEAGIDTPDV